MNQEPADLERIVNTLLEHHVEFIVVGGQAEYLFGSPRATVDVDLCYRRTPENLEKLARAIQPMNPRLRGAPPDLPFHADAQSLSMGDNFTFTTTFGDLDLLGHLEPIGGYDDLIERAETYEFGQHTLQVIALDDLIHIKQHVNRDKDQESLRYLLPIKQMRERGEC